MGVLFNRYLTVSFLKPSVVIGGRQEIRGNVVVLPPTIEFSFRFDEESNPNDGEILIHNMSPETQRMVLEEGAPVSVEAGYWPVGGQRETGVIFEGQITKAYTNFKNAGAVTRILVGDSEDAYAHARVRQVFDGKSHAEIAQAITESFKARGVQIGRVDVPDFTEPRPRTVDRLARQELEDLAYQHDLQWSIKNGVLNVYPRDEVNRPGRMILTPGTGVVGIPEFNDKGASIKTYMLPTINSGDVIQYQNDKIISRVTEDFKVQGIEFHGNNARGFFGTTIDARYLSEGKVIRSRERYIGGKT